MSLRAMSEAGASAGNRLQALGFSCPEPAPERAMSRTCLRLAARPAATRFRSRIGVLEEKLAPSLVALECELEQRLQLLRVRHARLLEQLRVDACRGEARDRVQLV